MSSEESTTAVRKIRASSRRKKTLTEEEDRERSLSRERNSKRVEVSEKFKDKYKAEFQDMADTENVEGGSEKSYQH